MKVSIITATFNSATTIADTLKSIASQDHGDIEHLVVDGCSTDDTLAIVAAFPGSRRVISEPDAGIYDAMNKGIGLAGGEIIGILNSDDVYEDEQVIRDVVRAFEADEALDMLYGDLVYVKAGDLNRIVRRWTSVPYTRRFFERGHVPPHPTLFVRRRVYEQAGRFDVQYRLAADYEFMLRMFKKHHFKVLYLPRLMVRMRLGGATNVSFSNIAKGNREIIQAWKHNGFKVPLLLMPLRVLKRIRQFF